jgi:HCOMODA/2-hydroxy-3-carboxy-muconic semialdehyde decarboxylase
MCRLCAPGLVTATDIDTYDLDSNSLRQLGRPYSERFIHGEIYKVRKDVNSIIHCHTPHLIPFGVSETPLLPIYQMSSFLGGGVPVFEIREHAGMSDLLSQAGQGARGQPERSAAGFDAWPRRDGGG